MRPDTVRPKRATLVSRDSFLAWLPVLSAAAYVVVFARIARRLLEQAYWSSDAVAPSLMAERLTGSDPISGPTHVTQPAYLFLDFATRHVPWHRTIWTVLPLVMALATVALIAWSVARFSNGWSAAVAAALAIAVQPAVLNSYLLPSYHGTTWFGTALLIAFVSLVVTARIGLGTVLGAACVVTIVGFAAASDALLMVSGIAPLVLTGLLFAILERRIDARQVLVIGVGVASAGLTLVARHWYAARGYVNPLGGATPIRLTAVGELPSRIGALWRGFLSVTSGWTSIPQLNTVPMATIASAIVVAASLGCMLWLALRMLAIGRTGPGRFFALSYWLISAMLVAGAFAASDVSAGLYSSRYLIPIAFSLAAGIPLAWGSLARGRLIGAIVSSIVILTAAFHLPALRAYNDRDPRPRSFPSLIAFLQAHNLHRGYAGYWQAHVISWRTHDVIEVLPVRAGCEHDDSGRLCPRLLNVSEGVFRPRRGATFVVTGGPDGLRAEPSRAAFGRPQTVYRFASFVVHVYRYDVAARLAHGIR